MKKNVIDINCLWPGRYPFGMAEGINLEVNQGTYDTPGADFARGIPETRRPALDFCRIKSRHIQIFDAKHRLRNGCEYTA